MAFVMREVQRPVGKNLSGLRGGQTVNWLIAATLVLIFLQIIAIYGALSSTRMQAERIADALERQNDHYIGAWADAPIGRDPDGWDEE